MAFLSYPFIIDDQTTQSHTANKWNVWLSFHSQTKFYFMHFFSLLNLQMAISAPPSSSRSPATTAHRHRQHTQWRHHLLILVAIFNLIQCISATPVFSYNPSFSNCKYQSNSFAIKNQNIHLFRKLWSNWDKTIRPCCPIIDSQIYSWFAVVRVWCVCSTHNKMYDWPRKYHINVVYSDIPCSICICIYDAYMNTNERRRSELELQVSNFG